MGAPRRLAATLLRAVLRVAPEESRDWASAMLRELDFIEGDWTTLLWALGSAAVILRHGASLWRTWFNRKTKQEAGMNNTGKKALGVGMGVLSALMLAGCAFAVLHIAGILLPGLEQSPWAYWLAVLAMPEAIFVAAAVLLWRRKGPMAAGILATGLMMGLHIAAHLATR